MSWALPLQPNDIFIVLWVAVGFFGGYAVSAKYTGARGSVMLDTAFSIAGASIGALAYAICFPNVLNYRPGTEGLVADLSAAVMFLILIFHIVFARPPAKQDDASAALHGRAPPPPDYEEPPVQTGAGHADLAA